ncbi:hypothetical protein JI435_129480 [Parastagonospora nodorum SN15]|uniref:Uncharacterized protein n=1 Tax=Phaeosphaeria nodorum (strain SN15 / ATCC MYA-4574 / FGSC 10173) TaxID=321614 RepID=A0A7U2FFB5_PHANO|nr:hypothetical protein JI435_129480 [Parastagonospora nodorum SN15]
MSATDDLKHAAGDVNHAAGKVVHDAEAAGYELKEKAESAAEDAKDKAVEVKEDVKENAQWAAEKTEENAKAAVESAQQKAKAAADKMADAAARADPRDLKPRNILDGLKNVDRTILRLNKLLASPGGLSAFLSTFNYSLYILAYLQSKSLTLSALATRILALVRPACDDTKIPPPR